MGIVLFSILSSNWNNSAICSSRSSNWNNSVLDLNSNKSARGYSDTVLSNSPLAECYTLLRHLKRLTAKYTTTTYTMLVNKMKVWYRH